MFDVSASSRYKSLQQYDSFSSRLLEVSPSRNFTDSQRSAPSVTLGLHPLMEYNGTPRLDSFTQGCRDLLRTFTYEDIMAWTIYAAPLAFMIGPAAVVAYDPVMSMALHSLVGFSLSWMLHRMGHRLLMTLNNEPHCIVLFRSLRLPVGLTLSQFIWTLEVVVGTAVFTGILAKRCFMMGDTVGMLMGLCLFAVGLGLFFVPVHLGRLWINRYSPAMPLVGPTDDVINQSFPGLRSFFK